MPFNFIGKVLFPSLQPWQRRRQLKTMLYVLFGALVFAALVGGVMFMVNSRPR
jgi:hypothetical protein